jgi:hypothetical protein
MTAGCGGSTTSNTTAIEQTVTTLFGALQRGEYTTACGAYTSATQALIEHAAQQLQGLTTADCPSALRVVEQATGRRNFEQLGRPRFEGITTSGEAATVTISAPAPGGLTAHSTFSVVREGDVWLVNRASSLQFSPAT